MTIRNYLNLLAAASMALLIAACATNISRGHLKEDEQVANIKVGITSKEEVQRILGSPSSESSFGPPTWYYASSIHKTRSVLPPEIIDQHVIEVAFDSGGIVTGLKQYNLSDSKDIEIAQQTTPTEGQKLGFFEQILSNLGRFNSDSNSASNSHTHGNTGVPTGYPGR